MSPSPVAPASEPTSTEVEAEAEAFLAKVDVLRALILVLVAAFIGIGLNFVRKPPLMWSYRTKAERLAEETAALTGGAAQAFTDAGGGSGSWPGMAAGQGSGTSKPGSGTAAFPQVSLGELRAVMAEGKAVVIDARPALFFRTGHLPGARNLPREGFQAAYGQFRVMLERDRDQPVVIYCGGGSCEDSDLIAAALRSLGFTRLSVFAGGWKEWQAAGLPVETGGGAVP